MADNDYPAGRRPSYDRAGNVRGFRSKPGAPLADPTNNLPMSEDRMTPKGTWNNMFKNSLTGNNPLSPEARAATYASPVDTVLNDIEQDEQFGGGVVPSIPKPLSLSTLAAGGPNHAQSWGGDSLKGWQAGNPSDILKKYQTPGTVASTTFGTKRTTGNKFGWGSSYGS